MQKFNKGDLVRIASDLGRSMSHFTSDCDAIVIGSYADQYGGRDTKSYTLHLKVCGESAWYYESQLTLIEANRPDILKEWEDAADTERRQKSDLDWIFAHGADVLKSPHGASLQALSSAIGMGNLWGSRGEGFDYAMNSARVMSIAAPYLERGDKAGWLSLTAQAVAPERA